MAERELLIWLKPTVAPGAGAAFKTVAEMARKAQNGTAEGHAKATRKMKEDLTDYERAQGKTYKQMFAEDLKRFKAQQAQIKQKAAEEKRATAEVAREKAKAHAAEERAARRKAVEERRAERERESARVKEERGKRQAENAERRAEMRQERAAERVGFLRTRAIHAAMHGAEKLMQVGRGAALMGLSGQNQKDVLEKLEMIQGVFDVAQGGVGLLRAGSHSLHAWHKYRHAAAAARGAAGVAKAGMGVAEGVEAAGMAGMAGVGGVKAAGAAGVTAAGAGSAAATIGAVAAIVGAVLVGAAAYQTSKSRLKQGGPGAGWEGDTWYGRPMQKLGTWWDGSEKRKKEKAEKLKEWQEKDWAVRGSLVEGRRAAEDEAAQIEYAGRRERMGRAYQGTIGTAEVERRRTAAGYTFGAEASHAAATEASHTAGSLAELAAGRAAATKAEMEEFQSTVQSRFRSDRIGDEEKKSDLKRLTELTQEYTKSVDELGKAQIEASQAALQAEQAEINKIKEKLETRKSGLLSMAGETPEERAKTTWAVQQAREHGIESLSPEMQRSVMQASAANPEWQRKFQAQQMEHEAPEFEKRWGMQPGEALRGETIHRAGGSEASVNVRTLNQIEILMHDDAQTIARRVRKIMDEHTREIEQAMANKRASETVARGQISSPQ